MSKSRSGLGRIQRDFSDAPYAAASSSSDLIPWDPTPPKESEPPRKKRELSEQEQAEKARAQKIRLLHIRQALASLNNGDSTQPQPSVPQPPQESPPTHPKAEKRPSIDPAESTTKKKSRVLPWDTDSLSDSSFSKSSSTKSSNDTRSPYWNNPHKGNTDQEKRFTPAVPTSQTSSTSSTSKKHNRVAKIFLSQEQTHILKLVKEGNSVFYTGSAGTGKSVLLREIIKTMRTVHRKTPEAVAITASTGLAACNIGGVTIHSFAGIGLGNEPADKLVDKVKKNKKALMRWLKTKVLIIDEVSMVDGDLFDKLAQIGSILRKLPNDPFGGIQVVVTGDFFQLPPVNKAGAQVKFAFEAEHWHSTIKKTFNLTQVFRQKDQDFIDMLNEMRFGRLSQKSILKFKSLSRPIVYEDGLGPTELFPRREDVEKSNGYRLQRLLTGETKVSKFLSTDNGTVVDVEQRNKMLANFMAPKELHLCVGAQVMLIKNVDDQLVNGTMGRVMRFVDPATYAGETVNDTANGSNPTHKKSASSVHLPVVEFSFPSGTQREILITPETWKVELPSGETQVSRTQLPLILAWAMSIHKSQGQTLDRVKVDLNRVFEKGQAYVALSRATSLEGLQILNFDAKKVSAHRKVAEWSLTLETISDDS